MSQSQKLTADMKFNSPCMNCKYRTMGCHSSCVKYKIFRTAQDRLNARLRQQQIADEASMCVRQKFFMCTKQQKKEY